MIVLCIFVGADAHIGPTAFLGVVHEMFTRVIVVFRQPTPLTRSIGNAIIACVFWAFMV